MKKMAPDVETDVQLPVAGYSMWFLSFFSAACSPFWVGDTPNVSGKHEVIVVADNRFDDARTILQKPGYDFYQCT